MLLPFDNFLTPTPLKLKHQIRFITAASLYDGHDAAIHIMRRILQHMGAEVIHLGHNRSAAEVVNAAIAEDAQGIAVSSYQGGHVEYFTYMLELLKKNNASHIKVFGGGGGVISDKEIKHLHKKGVCKIFSPDDGLQMGLEGMISNMLEQCDFISSKPITVLPKPFDIKNPLSIAKAITTLELGTDKKNKEYFDAANNLRECCQKLYTKNNLVPIIGITGTGGAGKSSLVDELLLRFLTCFCDKTVAVLSVDPSRKKTGGALLGDRIRLNSASNERVFVRSMATRRANLSTSATVKDAIACLQAAKFDLVILETAGIGQSDSEVADLCDIAVYVMTPEYGAASQLEKIDMLDFADLVAVNKFDKRGSLDALKDVQKIYQCNHKLFDTPLDKMPVFGTTAHKFNDLGTNSFFNALFEQVALVAPKKQGWNFLYLKTGELSAGGLIPPLRARYLSEISETIKNHHKSTDKQASIANRAFSCLTALSEFEKDEQNDKIKSLLKEKYEALYNLLTPGNKDAWHKFDKLKHDFESPGHKYSVRGKEYNVSKFTESLGGSKIPKIAAPNLHSWGDKIKFLAAENFPGYFPFTAGVFPFKRQGEDPTRMFAGEGTPERTNKRFHLVSYRQPAVRLSTAFDSPTLYGANPDNRPDIYGKIGNAGVSVCSLDDSKRLYSGFDLCAPSTSVSMTINGPAPIMLAYFFNTAIDAECEKHLRENGQWLETEAKIADWFKAKKLQQPTYRQKNLPKGHNEMGLGFLGLPASFIVDKPLYQKIREHVLHVLRGTVQADILKEDQAQNTCIFSSEFALKMMGDVQQYFIDHNVRNFYSVSISGYHIAEAGANPITQLAFTLANGFTMVEYYRSRGMDVNKFAPNLSFFFSNGLDPEYSVIGRVARRIWAIAMRNTYQANDRSQKLKYHIQTSGRSLHAQEIAFNDIRTTLQALYAIADNCNSLHTNAYDEAITTPTEESVKRALAIQLIINRELGYTKNENPLQGSYFIEQMTKIVEDAVLKEFEALDARGGVLGAMETMYQRSKIQGESHHYEIQKHSGELPIVGVNTFKSSKTEAKTKNQELIRSSPQEKDIQVKQIADLTARFPKDRKAALSELKKAAISGENIFAQLMETCQVCSIGEISDALYEVGGAYRRSM